MPRENNRLVRYTQDELEKKLVEEMRNRLDGLVTDADGNPLPVDVSRESPLRQLAQVAASLPAGQMSDDIVFAHQQVFLDSVVDAYFDRWLESHGLTRRTAQRASGTIEVTLDSALEPTSEPDPWITDAGMRFSDGQGREFENTEAESLPGKVVESAPTGTQSESIDTTTNTRIAQKFTITEEQGDVMPGHVTVRVAHGSNAPTFKVRIETHDANNDQPSGTLAQDNLELTGFQPTDATDDTAHFNPSGRIEPGTYWVVLEATDGDGTFDGGTGGDADQVKVFDGSWTLDSNVDNLNLDIHGDLIIDVQAIELGANGNIPADTINSPAQKQFLDSSLSSRWNEHVETFVNQEEFTGGQDRETLSEGKLRVQNQFSAKETAREDGIALAVERVAGVESVTIIENDTETGGTEDTVFESTETGTGSETLDGSTNTRIAQKVVIDDRRFVQHFNAALQTDNSLEATVRLETDNAGEPSGALVDPVFELAGFSFPAGGGGSLSSGSFANGRYLDAGTYWLVFEHESGDGTLDGGTGGDADQVLAFDGSSWTADSNIENANTKVIGGVPPHGFRIIADGGDKDEKSQAIFDAKASGATSDGLVEGTAENRIGDTKTIRHDEPTLVPIKVKVTLKKNALFTGDADSVRDTIITYIGGEDTGETPHDGLGVGETLYRDQVTRRLTDPDTTPGGVSVPSLAIDRKNDLTNPETDDPTSTNEEYTATKAEKFTVEETDDILVTLEDE